MREPLCLQPPAAQRLAVWTDVWVCLAPGPGEPAALSPAVGSAAKTGGRVLRDLTLSGISHTPCPARRSTADRELFEGGARAVVLKKQDSAE